MFPPQTLQYPEPSSRQVLCICFLTGQLDHLVLELTGEILHVTKQHEDREEVIVDAVCIIGKKFLQFYAETLDLFEIRFRTVHVKNRECACWFSNITESDIIYDVQKFFYASFCEGNVFYVSGTTLWLFKDQVIERFI